jgi:hypothetical protein
MKKPRKERRVGSPKEFALQNETNYPGLAVEIGDVAEWSKAALC